MRQSPPGDDADRRAIGGAGLAAWAVISLLFLSGLAGLVYQVLWMKQLGLLFGNTAAAASTTLGLAAAATRRPAPFSSRRDPQGSAWRRGPGRGVGANGRVLV